jgi:mannose-6-phosphate isomerase-like protein (cupin superfamily)
MAQKDEILTMTDGTQFRFTKPVADTDGERVEMEITLPPGAASPPRHVHPAQDEQWEVLSGVLSVWFDGGWRELRAGESLAIPKGAVHTLENRSPETVRVRDTHVPALDFEDYIEKLGRLAQEGKIGSSRRLSTLIYFSMVWREQRSQVAASPVLRAAMWLLARAGRALGYRTG